MPRHSFMACVYFNGVKLPIDFGLLEDTTCLTLLRSKLNNMLSDIENKNRSSFMHHELILMEM